MSFSLALLLLHSTQVPDDARLAIRAALDAPAEQQEAHLVRAARILAVETGVGCADALELVGLPNDPTGRVTCG